jgi:hypothetical protein
VRSIDRRAYLAHEIAFRFNNRWHLGDQRRGETRGGRIVKLSDVRNRVLARRGFERHGTARRDETVRSIATSRLTVIARLG